MILPRVVPPRASDGCVLSAQQQRRRQPHKAENGERDTKWHNWHLRSVAAQHTRPKRHAQSSCNGNFRIATPSSVRNRTATKHAASSSEARCQAALAVRSRSPYSPKRSAADGVGAAATRCNNPRSRLRTASCQWRFGEKKKKKATRGSRCCTRAAVESTLTSVHYRWGVNDGSTLHHRFAPQQKRQTHRSNSKAALRCQKCTGAATPVISNDGTRLWNACASVVGPRGR